MHVFAEHRGDLWDVLAEFLRSLFLLFASMMLSHCARALQADTELSNMLDAVLLQRQR